MRKLVERLLVVALFVGAGVAFCQGVFPTYSYRYRLTLTVEIDGKVRTGSSVIEVRWQGHPEFPGAGRFSPEVAGQAVFVDLAERGALIAVLTAPNESDTGGSRFPEGVPALWLAARAFGNKSTEDEVPLLPKLSGRRELEPGNLPRLIWFSNIADPKTARVIMPGDISKIFYPSSRLISASVEITRDRNSIDIDKKLPWYSDLAERQKSGRSVLHTGVFELQWGMFIGSGS